MVDERILYDTFGRFGTLVAAPKIARDDNNLSKGYGFVSFANFESSDDAIANMNGQYLMNKEVSVQYAYKKDGKGERHGDQAERMLATQAQAHGVQPNASSISVGQMFGGAMPGAPIPAGFGMPSPQPNGIPHGNYAAVPPPSQARPPPPPSTPLSAAPTTGLPARPPPTNAGYGGPQSFLPPGFNNPTHSFPSAAPTGGGQPAGFPAMPAGFGPPSMGPGAAAGGVPPPPIPPPPPAAGFQPYTRR